MTAKRFKELDVVALRQPHGVLRAGRGGTVLEVFTDPPGYLVEFSDANGVAIDIPVLQDEDLDPCTGSLNKGGAHELPDMSA